MYSTYPTYIHQRPEWPNFTWNQSRLAQLLADVRHRQGKLIGRMEGLGFHLQEEAVLSTLTQDVLKSSDIEGESLDMAQVRSSIARKLGLDIAGAVLSERHVDGVVEMMLDATQRYQQPLSPERLCGWHSALFPTGMSGLYVIEVGHWRTDAKGPMQVISGNYNHERVHFEAPAAARLEQEMRLFLAWVNQEPDIDPVLVAAIAHFWFITIHPFDDGNGRIARAVADWALARSEGSAQRFYSMSSQIRVERSDYYDMLEQSQKGGVDITDWVTWFLGCLGRAIRASETTLGGVLAKAKFWDLHAAKPLNERQRLMLNKLLDSFEGKLTSTKWAKMAKTSQDTAQRDIQGLIDMQVMRKDEAGGRSTSYSVIL